MGSMMADLRKYAQANKPKTRCMTCSLPGELLQTIRQGRREGVSYQLLVGFLRTKGHKIATTTLQHHFVNHEK